MYSVIENRITKKRVIIHDPPVELIKIGRQIEGLVSGIDGVHHLEGFIRSMAHMYFFNFDNYLVQVKENLGIKYNIEDWYFRTNDTSISFYEDGYFWNN